MSPELDVIPRVKVYAPQWVRSTSEYRAALEAEAEYLAYVKAGHLGAEAHRTGQALEAAMHRAFEVVERLVRRGGPL